MKKKLIVVCALLIALAASVSAAGLYGPETEYYLKANKIFKTFQYGSLDDSQYEKVAAVADKQWSALYNEIYGKLKATKTQSELANINSVLKSCRNEISVRCYVLISFLGKTGANRSKYRSKLLSVEKQYKDFRTTDPCRYEAESERIYKRLESSSFEVVNNTFRDLKGMLSSEDYAKLAKSQNAWASERDSYFKKFLTLLPPSDYDISPKVDWNIDRAYYLLYLIK